MEKAGGYISEIFLNDGSSMGLEKDSIVVFVGPNNARKSQTLRDLYALADTREGQEPFKNTIIVGKMKVEKSKAPIVSVLNEIAEEMYDGHNLKYIVMNKHYYINGTDESLAKFSSGFSQYRDLFVVNLSTDARLQICNPVNNIARDAPKGHPIHYAAFDRNCRRWLSENFKKAFNKNLIPNTQFGSSIPLCIGDPVKLDGTYSDEQDRLEEYAERLANYDQVHKQGDGIKSFTGILLYLMLDYYRVYLIDEPEAFLHPPQAQIMGQIIGETLSDSQQAFISTHSEDIIKGLIDVCPHRLKIVRITRNENTNKFSILDNNELQGIWKDPLLRYSNIMKGLFHKTVVLCESDSDCKFYSAIEEHLKRSKGFYSETYFIHCGGKQRIEKIASALRALDIDLKIIVDMDVLCNSGEFKKIVEVFNVNWNDIENKYKIIRSNVEGSIQKLKCDDVRKEVNDILDNVESAFLSNEDISSIKEAVKKDSGWSSIKSGGISAIPRGDAVKAFNVINKTLKDVGIFLVPVGELEGFITEVGGHGPQWVNSVFERYPNFDDDVYQKVKDFIRGMQIE